MLPEEGVNAVRVVVALLVRGDYEELETLTEGRRLSASDMAAALAGHDLLSPPEEAFGELEVTGAEQVSARRARLPRGLPAVDGAGRPLRADAAPHRHRDHGGVWAADLDGIGP
ncbi:hypothetical protein LUX57_53335 [Actinomadura madurae]|uniref:hypothetical protein n=1 Tax=Actinomadura madurae TaxID=1993 RepID=UPI0020D249E9|nr:hypothetical protein [Actinomadura madurae]MCP9972786.1 hypothetical protein [Actinomadura madurae]